MIELSPAYASAYIVEYHAEYGGAFIVDASHGEIDGLAVVHVTFTTSGGAKHYADVWIETRADGSTYLYGEW